MLDPPPAASQLATGDQPPIFAIGLLVAGLATLQIVLLAGPAFAVGARRRQRELALVAAAGGTPAQLRRIVLADGVVLGLLGAVAGVAIGAAAAVATLPLMAEHLLHRPPGGVRLFPLALLAAAAMAVLAGLLAAVVPASSAARQPVVAMLAGRRGVARAGRLLPVSPRIALRDTARNRGATAPAVSAVMAAVAGGLTIGVFADSDRQREEAA